jgi:hypothetical protein
MKIIITKFGPILFLIIFLLGCRKQSKTETEETTIGKQPDSTLKLIWSGGGQGVIWPGTCSGQSGFASLLSYLGKIQDLKQSSKVVIGGDSLVVKPKKPAFSIPKYLKLLEYMDKYGVDLFVPGQSELALLASPEAEKIEVKSSPGLLQLQLSDLQKSFRIFQEGELKIALVSLIPGSSKGGAYLPEIWKRVVKKIKASNPQLIIACFSMERKKLDQLLEKFDSPPDLVFLTGKTGKAQLQYKLGDTWVFRTSGGFSSVFKFTFSLKYSRVPFLFLNEKERYLQKQKRLTKGLNNLNRILNGKLQKQRREIFWKRRKAIKRELQQTGVVLQKFDGDKKTGNTFKMEVINLKDLHPDQNVEQLLLKEGFEQKRCNK